MRAPAHARSRTSPSSVSKPSAGTAAPASASARIRSRSASDTASVKTACHSAGSETSRRAHHRDGGSCQSVRGDVVSAAESQPIRQPQPFLPRLAIQTLEPVVTVVDRKHRMRRFRFRVDPRGNGDAPLGECPAHVSTGCQMDSTVERQDGLDGRQFGIRSERGCRGGRTGGMQVLNFPYSMAGSTMNSKSWVTGSWPSAGLGGLDLELAGDDAGGLLVVPGRFDGRPP